MIFLSKFVIITKLMFDFKRGVAQSGLARLLWEQEVGGSNPLTPTNLTFYATVAQPDRATAF